MTRAEVLAQYDVDANGIIKSPGKFEGEMLYVPALWDIVLDGGSDDEQDDDGLWVSTINVDAELRAEWPEIGDTKVIRLRESEQGFVYTEEE